MIVQCPDCHTRFRLAEARLVGANPMLKCSRCRHIFPAPRRQRSAGEARAPKGPPPPPDSEINLSFEEQIWDTVQPELPWKTGEEDFSLGASALTPTAPPPQAAYPTETDPESEADEQPPSAADGSPEDTRRPRTLGPAPFPTSTADDADDADNWVDVSAEGIPTEPDDDGDAEEYSMTQRHTSLIPCLIIFLVVVTGYFFFSRMLLSDQEFAETFVSRLPLVGGSLAADRLLFRKVALSEVTGAFLRLKEGKEVFVVSGNALNTATRPLRNVQIQGSLLDSSGQEVRREVITCGGMISNRLLRDLTARELDILRKVEPQRRFSLAPGESTPFAIVFLDAPRTAVEYTSRVTTAQRQS